jgi:phosphopantetheine adenylyltransferase
MMQLPLTAVVQAEDDNLVAIFEAKTNRRICMLYGNTSSEDAYDIVVAVNERATMQAEIERLRDALDTVQTMAMYIVEMANGLSDVEAQVVTQRRLRAIADYARAALDAGQGENG